MMNLKVRPENISAENEWEDALTCGNEHTTRETGYVSVIVSGLTPDEAKHLIAALEQGVQI